MTSTGKKQNSTTYNITTPTCKKMRKTHNPRWLRQFFIQRALVLWLCPDPYINVTRAGLIERIWNRGENSRVKAMHGTGSLAPSLHLSVFLFVKARSFDYVLFFFFLSTFDLPTWCVYVIYRVLYKFLFLCNELSWIVPSFLTYPQPISKLGFVFSYLFHQDGVKKTGILVKIDLFSHTIKWLVAHG